MLQSTPFSDLLLGCDRARSPQAVGPRAPLPLRRGLYRELSLAPDWARARARGVFGAVARRAHRYLPSPSAAGPPGSPRSSTRAQASRGGNCAHEGASRACRVALFAFEHAFRQSSRSVPELGASGRPRCTLGGARKTDEAKTQANMLTNNGPRAPRRTSEHTRTYAQTQGQDRMRHRGAKTARRIGAQTQKRKVAGDKREKARRRRDDRPANRHKPKSAHMRRGAQTRMQRAKLPAHFQQSASKAPETDANVRKASGRGAGTPPGEDARDTDTHEAPSASICAQGPGWRRPEAW